MGSQLDRMGEQKVKFSETFDIFPCLQIKKGITIKLKNKLSIQS